MKKLLLLSVLVTGLSAQAQEFWGERATGFTTASTGVNEIRYVDGNVVWVTGYDGSGGGAQFRVFSKSGDGGETWTPGPITLGSTDLGIGSLSPVSSSVAWVAAFPNATTVQGGIWKTENGGTSWTKQPSASFNTGTDSFTNIVYFWDSNVGVSAGDPASGYFEIYTTLNGGANWTRVPSSNIPAPLDGEYGYTRIFEVAGTNTIWLGTNKGRLLRSSDRGVTWSIWQTPNTDFGDADLGASFTFQNETEGLMIGKDFTQYTTSNGGQTWSEAQFPDGTIRNGDVTYVPGYPNFLISIGEDALDGVRGSSYSSDNGASWVDLGEPIDAVSAVEFFDATHGLASGFTASAAEGGIYKWLSDVNEFLATVDFQSTKAITASPNPTTGILEIAGKNIANVTAFDILGKQVVNTNYTAMDKVTLNLSAFNSGIYMVKVSNNAGAVSTIKVVKQ